MEGHGSQGATPAWPALQSQGRWLLDAACASFFLSSPGRLSSKGCFHHLSSQDSPGEACKTASARVRQSCGKPVEEPPSDLTRIRLSRVATSSAPAHSCWPFPNSGLSHMSCRIEFLSQWNMIKVLLFPWSSHFESKQGHLSCHQPVPSFWGGPTNREGETDSPSVANPDVQKLLETEITERIQTKVWGEEEQDDLCTPQMLEAHSIMSGLNFHWDLPLLSLEPEDLKACEAQHSAFPRSPFPPQPPVILGPNRKLTLHSSWENLLSLLQVTKS
ncbi:spermatogenesis-associated protein 31E1-like isoform X2 [Equus caballus]|uniref:spermatogenesis-associated protein 31E1-like isoform X2 n=1 Tax=Equus caballus TaxID=9796 RepID=UPI0038B37929